MDIQGLVLETARFLKLKKLPRKIGSRHRWLFRGQSEMKELNNNKANGIIQSYEKPIKKQRKVLDRHLILTYRSERGQNSPAHCLVEHFDVIAHAFCYIVFT